MKRRASLLIGLLLVAGASPARAGGCGVTDALGDATSNEGLTSQDAHDIASVRVEALSDRLRFRTALKGLPDEAPGPGGAYQWLVEFKTPVTGSTIVVVSLGFGHEHARARPVDDETAAFDVPYSIDPVSDTVSMDVPYADLRVRRGQRVYVRHAMTRGLAGVFFDRGDGPQFTGTAEDTDVAPIAKSLVVGAGCA